MTRMYYDDVVSFIDRCGGRVVDEQSDNRNGYVTVRATFPEVRDFDMPENVVVNYSTDYVVFSIDYSVPDL